MSFIRLSFVFIFACSPLVLFAQNPGWENHLCTSHIADIAEREDTLWIAAHGGGLLAYDKPNGGTHFFNKINSAIPSVFLNSVELDSKGNVWLGTNDGGTGLVRYSGGNSWTSYNMQNSPMPSGNVLSLCAYDTTIWIGTENGLAKFDGINWTIYTSCVYMFNTYSVTNVKDIATDSAGNIWVCCYNVGLMRFDGINWTVYTHANSDINSYDMIQCVTVDCNGKVWVGNAMGISKFDGANWTYINNPFPTTMLNGITDIKVDSNGKVFSIRQDNYLISYDGISYQNLGYGISGLFPAPALEKHQYSTNNLLFSDSGELWVGYGVGLARYNGTWTDYTSVIQSDLLGEGIKALKYEPFLDLYAFTEFHHPNNSSIVYSGAGLAKFDGTSWSRTKIPDSCLKYDCGYSLIVKDSSSWVGIRNGVSFLTGSNQVTYSWSTPCNMNELTTAIGKLGSQIYCGTNLGNINRFDGTAWYGVATPLSLSFSPVNNLVSQDSLLLVGSTSGLMAIDTAMVSHYTILNSPLPSDTVNEIFPGKPMWLATDKGLVKTNLINWSIYNMSNSNIPSNQISCVTGDSLGNIWIGTKGFGIARFDGSVFTTYNTHNSGLTDDWINNLIVDNMNDIWIGTRGGGLCVFRYGTGMGIGNHNQANATIQEGLKWTLSPNPFRERLDITTEINVTAQVLLKVYDVFGREIKTILDSHYSPGQLQTNWDGKDEKGKSQPSGIYYIVLSIGTDKSTKKAILVP